MKWALAALACWAATAFADAPAPFTRDADAKPADETEQRLWGGGEEFDRLIARTDLVVHDPALQAYLQSVMERLFPQLKGTIRVRVLRLPSLNAFALPNGSIYIHTGLLARFDNEAQLAAVLAHEGSHFTNRHGLRLQEHRKSLSAVQLVTGLFGLPFPLVRDLVLASSMFGYSRDMERDADASGFVRMREAGYDLAESPRVFEHLAQELKASGIDEPFFFSTHPKLTERIESYKALLKGEAGGGEVGREAYEARVAALRLASLEADLAMDRPMSVLAALDFGARCEHYPPQVRHLLAEALRKRGAPGDADIAAALDQYVLATVPDYLRPHFSLGVHHLKRGEPGPAAEHLSLFLAGAPGARERAFAESYLREAQALRDGQGK